MDKQRRYEIQDMADRLDAIIQEMIALADEEETAFKSRPPASQLSVAGQDSQEAYEALRLIAAAIADETLTLREIGEPRPKHQRL
ncbi:hypothetical protein [Bradyrhizobium iriomotense]|uniref:Uncharacterized protein n=1 Tax=Bradyrhizobium iriomotense TaxID=441950 RepID=A0ABQ6BBZ5_9BRAD|nr:hypothetical protein [Bradyrhizobium iriomotense]GLR91376.1 hypothetical protein GCM10007857_80930 [Bradyrhizobium iriomotense]